MTKDGNVIIVKGTIRHSEEGFYQTSCHYSIDGNKITIKPYGTRKRDFAVTNTARSIITGMIKGVEKGHTYRLKIIFAHFPITVKVKGREVHAENFFGERSPRDFSNKGGSALRSVCWVKMSLSKGQV